MDKRELSRVNLMNYSYIIKNKKIYELEEEEKISYDKFGHEISFLIKNQHMKNQMSSAFRRKLEWLQRKHSEQFL